MSTLLCHIVSTLPECYYLVETVVMVIRSPPCSYVKRDLYWVDTISSTACATHVRVCVCGMWHYTSIDESQRVQLHIYDKLFNFM